MAAKKRPSRPRRDPNEIVRRGIRGYELAVRHRARLEERLAPATIEGLASDLEKVGEVVPAALSARGERKAATGAQRAAAETAKGLVMAIRKSVAESGLGKAARQGFGEGVRVQLEVVKSVVAAGELILARAESHPEEARKAGVLPRDLEALTRALADLRGADFDQERKKVSQKESTGARNATLARIEATVRRVSAAGQLEFAAEPEVAMEFAATTEPVTKAATEEPATEEPAVA